VQSSSNIDLILKSAGGLGEPVHVHGAHLAAQALIVARHVHAQTPRARQVVVICPDHDTAIDFVSDLECLITILQSSSPNPSAIADVRLFPSWEQSAYSPIAPSIRTRLGRLSTLHSLTSLPDTPKGPPVIVTTIAAACQSTIPRETFLKYSLALKVGDIVESRESLIAKLLESGYFRVDTVEDPGSFAVRGDIIDLFAPNLDRPVRLELFGDEVERIRYFDPTTQRTSQKDTDTISTLSIAPAREVLINPETAADLRDQLKSRSDDQGISRARRDPILASVQNGSYPDHCDAWAPFAYSTPETLWNYLLPRDGEDDNTDVIFIDELSCMQTWDEFLKQQHRLAEEATSSSLILPAVQDLFRWTPPLEEIVRKKTRLFLDRIELATLDTVDKTEEEEQPAQKEETLSAHHRVFVRTNSDLSDPKARPRHSLEDLDSKLRLWIKQGFKILALASTQSQLDRIKFLLHERGLPVLENQNPQQSVICLSLGTLSTGFRWPAEGLVILTEQDLLGTQDGRTTRGQRSSRSRKRADSETSAAKSWSGLQMLSDLSVGDTVVHVDHGIGRYQGLVRLSLSGAPSDFLLLEYANRDKLYLPVYRLNVVQKYVGGSESVALDRLGTLQFTKTKDKVKDAVKKLAIDLIQLYAERKVRPGIRISPPDSLFREFEAKFPFDETPDQLKAVDDVLHDMESGRAMDRLICGDVGYGKTEIAIRAAFRAITDGKQVALLVPTTVLAFQHEQSFKARMADYPINIESISRFKSAKEQKQIIEKLATGKVDLVIGTHRILSKDVQFKNLGLVIVDEEHRFGVEHKEKLKTIKTNTHVLTLTATPIPRTLHMSLSGLRDISLINTAPVDRLPIRTYVSRYDESLIQRAIQFELNRGGQVFFLHNRVQTIHEVARKIREMVPGIEVGIAHGQLTERELEETMLAFYQKKTRILVCTTIVESGLDVPSANTILIDRADTLGLAQLYQIRGRVGRGQSRAYAYLLIPAESPVSDDAKRRLEVIQKFVELGSGFSVASHDLEIRGGGDLLGPQQSGNINAVGFDLYMELLEDAIRELEGKPMTLEESAKEPEIKAPFPAFLEDSYVPDIHQRLSLYRRFSATTQESEITALEEELRDRFGPLPAEAQNLIWLIRLKLLLKQNGIESLTVGPERISLVSGTLSRLNPARAIALVSRSPDQYQLLPDSKFVAKIPTASFQELLFAAEKLLNNLC
jgi:transcription-repair coupling factor (superfamily II helicase)